tara:strand:+ start:2440 stop:2730 length:291 start_codon:yes stop_codon:yes gene_type:complete
MINFSGFFNKKFLITLFGLFFISLVTLDPLFHDHNVIEDEHSELECHFCLIETYDDVVINKKIEKNFSNNFLLQINLNTYYKSNLLGFNSRAPPKI